MFGDDILFAPITHQGQTEKNVYLPKGQWIRTTDKTEHTGGRTGKCRAEINEFIAFVRKDSGTEQIFIKYN